jgi:hypothetical protein
MAGLNHHYNAKELIVIMIVGGCLTLTSSSYSQHEPVLFLPLPGLLQPCLNTHTGEFLKGTPPVRHCLGAFTGGGGTSPLTGGTSILTPSTLLYLSSLCPPPSPPPSSTSTSRTNPPHHHSLSATLSVSVMLLPSQRVGVML